MMLGGEKTPTLEEAGLPEFRGATLHLASKPTTNSDKDMFVDIVDLSNGSHGDNSQRQHSVDLSEPPRKRQNHQAQSTESGT